MELSDKERKILYRGLVALEPSVEERTLIAYSKSGKPHGLAWDTFDILKDLQRRLKPHG